MSWYYPRGVIDVQTSLFLSLSPLSLPFSVCLPLLLCFAPAFLADFTIKQNIITNMSDFGYVLVLQAAEKNPTQRAGACYITEMKNKLKEIASPAASL